MTKHIAAIMVNASVLALTLSAIADDMAPTSAGKEPPTKPAAVSPAPIADDIAPTRAKKKPATGAVSPAPAADDIADAPRERLQVLVERYTLDSRQQLKRKVASVRASDLSEDEKNAAIKELNSQPFYGALQVDIPPGVGDIGVLPQNVVAKVHRVIDEFDMLIQLSWYNDRFKARYYRVVWVRGVSTEGHAVGTEMPLGGVFLVTQMSTYDGKKGEKVSVPVLEAIDLTRFVTEGFEEKKSEGELHDRAGLHAEMKLDQTAEDIAASWLKLAKAYRSDGYDVMATKRLEMLIQRYPDTAAAKEAKSMLSTVSKTPSS